ncbi:MAG: glycosyltransferase [Butyrivibrio sp.]|nr:glycosyltransferase [Acetatifactor muris]MCM1559187.1 glycosyltransferase [Butyrivibrio sp.]
MISVIVPVYNTKEYLERCVNSLLAQTWQDMEIILVDDGSTDGSGEICDRFAERDGRVRVFHKENGGSSSARNLGIDKAKGDYIGFADSDDYVEPDMYERLYAAVCRYHVNAAQIGRDERDGEGNMLPDICIPPEKSLCIPPEEFMRELLMHRGDCSFCTKLIRREMFFPEEPEPAAGREGGGESRFPLGMLNEDFRLLIQMLHRLGPIVSLPGHAYHVFYRLGSNSRKESRDDFSRVYADCVDNADLAAEIVSREYPALQTTAFRFGVFQRLEYMLHIPIAQMNRENGMYRDIVRYLRRNWLKAMGNPLLTGKNKVYHTLFALAPKGIRKLHRRLRQL